MFPEVRIVRNRSLRTVNGFQYLRWLSALTVIDNAGLTELGGFASLAHVKYGLEISGNPELAELGALQTLSTAGSVTLRDLPALRDLSALSRLQSVEGELHIQDVALVDLQGLSRLDSADWIVVARTDIETLDGLGELDDADVRLAANARLTSLQGLPPDRLRRLVLEANPQLLDLTGLATIAAIDEELAIIDAPSPRSPAWSAFGTLAATSPFTSLRT